MSEVSLHTVLARLIKQAQHPLTLDAALQNRTVQHLSGGDAGQIKDVLAEMWRYGVIRRIPMPHTRSDDCGYGFVMQRQVTTRAIPDTSPNGLFPKDGQMLTTGTAPRQLVIRIHAGWR